jgi:retron-type reverse transcriptase
MADISNIFDEMVSSERLFEAWYEFKKGKSARYDVQEFGRHAEKHIFKLRRELISGTYRHSPYESFFVHDPKRRHIRKASVRDRLVHHTLHMTLRQIYEPRLYSGVYSNRIGKGTHRAVEALQRAVWKVSKNLTHPCWALKCDIKRFYDSVDHEILKDTLAKVICDEKALRLLSHVIDSFHVEGSVGKGAPIGNLTSQIFTNIFLNDFDQYVKHTLRVKHYLRFADDCLFLAPHRQELEDLLPIIEEFLATRLKLTLHPNKISIRPLNQGIDFLGIVVHPFHRTLRTTTKRRMLRKLAKRHQEACRDEISPDTLNQSLQSYLGILSHTDGCKLSTLLKNRFCYF